MKTDKHGFWPKCPSCEGKGVVEYGETCWTCGGVGRDPKCCEKCEEPGIGFNDDGEFLCEDCAFEEVSALEFDRRLP